MKNDFHTLITNMKALRIFSGSSQEQTSASLHLSRSTYASYESGLRTPDLDTSKSFLLSTMFRCRIWSMHLWKS